MTEYTCDSFRFFNLFPVYFGGKGTMPVRSADIGIYNFQPTLGAFLCILAWVGCFLVGAWKIRRQDIVGLTP